MRKATKLQLQFLRQLGYRSYDHLTQEEAHNLIKKLVKSERESNKTFPFPYCKKRFGPRPSHKKKCPSCGRTITHIAGKFYTDEKIEETKQNEWMRENQKCNASNVKDDWREEKKYRKEFHETDLVGYLIVVGSECSFTEYLNGVLVLIEDAFDTPSLLPPHKTCRHDKCECDYELVTRDEIPRGTKIAEWADPVKQAKLTTRNKYNI